MRSKFLSLLLIIALVSPSLFSQKKHRYGTGTKFDIIAGFDLQNFYGTDFWGETLKNQFQLGFHAGADINIPLMPDFYVQAGLFFHNKGSRQDTVVGSIRSTSLSYGEIPVEILYRPQVGDGHLLVGIGPFVAYGLYGMEKLKAGNVTDKVKVKFVNNAPSESTSFSYYRPLDSGVEIRAGYELYSSFFLLINAQVGLLKIDPSYGATNNKTSRKNIGYGFSAGYRF